MRNGDIGPHDVLAIGTKVRVGQKIGKVVGSREEDAVPSGRIVIHTIEFTHKIVRVPRPRQRALQRVQTYDVNYSFIHVLSSEGFLK
jgi:hypothetical protein